MTAIRGRFDLEKALSAWQRSLAFNRIFDADDLEELERHLRDQVAALMARGMAEEAAFHRALEEMGSYGEVEVEYRKVYWGKRRRSRALLSEFHWRTGMLKNYLRIAYRSVLREKSYAVINVFGLAVGIAFCTLLFLYVRDELTYDRFHEQKDLLFRVYRLSYQPDGSVRNQEADLPAPVGPALLSEFPEIASYVRLSENEFFVRSSENTFTEDVLFADPAFFEAFTFPLRQGNPREALSHLNAVVLSPEAAEKYFGTTEALGKTLSIRLTDRFEAFTVTGIAEAVPPNSTIRFDLLLPFAKMNTFDWARDCMERWDCSWLTTYVELSPSASQSALEAKLADFWGRHNPDERVWMRSEGRWSGAGAPARYALQPIEDVHLNPSVTGGLGEPSRPLYSYLLTAIGFGVLLIACINFTTLAIGRSARRGKEIGIRKVVGARRSQLMAQFWGEALLMSLVALGIGIVLAMAFLPLFNTLTGKSLRLDLTWTSLAALTGLLLLTGLVAGSYPALILSRFKPVEVLKSKLRLGGANLLTRTLVVLQFGLVIFLMIGTLTLLRQLDFMRSKDLGFEKEHVVVIPLNDVDGAAALRLFRNELGPRTDVLGITGADISFSRGYIRTGVTVDGRSVQVYDYGVEPNYLEVLGISLQEGHAFDPDLTIDSTRSVIVNAALVRAFGLIDPVGKVVPGYPGEPVVVGVAEDFNFRSLRETVEPVMLRPGGGTRYVLVRIAPDRPQTTLEALRATWQQIAPDLPFSYAFLDDDLDGFYREEHRWSRIIGYTALFAVCIACLGMFGLAAVTAAGRTKEIGIRKALGASVFSVTALLSRDFALLVVISTFLAAPASYFVAARWLGGFAYHIRIGPDLFLITGGLALLIALLTVSYQAVRAALADPVKSLRYE